MIKYLVMKRILGFRFIDSLLGQINRLRDSKGIIIHAIIVVTSTRQRVVPLMQTLAFEVLKIQAATDASRRVAYKSAPAITTCDGCCS